MPNNEVFQSKFRMPGCFDDAIENLWMRVRRNFRQLNVQIATNAEDPFIEISDGQTLRLDYTDEKH